MAIRYEGCQSVELHLEIVLGNFFLLQYIGVRWKKKVVLLGTVFRIYSHFHKGYNDAVHLTRLPLWVH